MENFKVGDVVTLEGSHYMTSKEYTIKEIDKDGNLKVCYHDGRSDKPFKIITSEKFITPKVFTHKRKIHYGIDEPNPKRKPKIGDIVSFKTDENRQLVVVDINKKNEIKVIYFDAYETYDFVITDWLPYVCFTQWYIFEVKE